MSKNWKPDYFDDLDREPDEYDGQVQENRCNRCGSTDVRWRMQGGKWTLFSLKPGVLHVCAPDSGDFGVVP